MLKKIRNKFKKDQKTKEEEQSFSSNKKKEKELYKLISDHIPYHIRLKTIEYFDWHNFCTMEFSISLKGKVIMKGIDNTMNLIGMEYSSMKKMKQSEGIKKLYGYFREDRKRKVFLIYPMVKISLNICEKKDDEENGWGFGMKGVFSKRRNEKGNSKKMKEIELGHFVPNSVYLKRLQISGDSTYLGENVSTKSVPKSIEHLSIIGGKHMEDEKLLELMNNLPKLKSVYISQRWFNPPRPVLEYTKEIFTRLSSLESISLWRVKLIPEAGEILSKSTTLKKLIILQSEAENGEGFKNIGNLKELMQLEIPYSNFLDEHVSFLTNSKKLKILDLQGNKLTDKSIDYLGKIESLKVLDISFSEIGGKGLSELLKNSKVSSLGFEGERDSKLNVSLSIVDEINNTTLESIKLNGRDIGEGGFELFSKCKNLSNIEMLDCQSSHFKVLFEKCTNIKSLKCSSLFTKNEIGEFLKKSEIEELHLYGKQTELNSSGAGDQELNNFIIKECLSVQEFLYSGNYMFDLKLFTRKDGKTVNVS